MSFFVSLELCIDQVVKLAALLDTREVRQSFLITMFLDISLYFHGFLVAFIVKVQGSCDDLGKGCRRLALLLLPKGFRLY